MKLINICAPLILILCLCLWKLYRYISAKTDDYFYELQHRHRKINGAEE